LYLGSVRFFKHFIIAALVILVIVPIAFAALFYLEADQKKAENKRLKNDNKALAAFASHYKGDGLLSSEDVYLILQDLQIKNSDLISLVYKKDKSAFESILSVPALVNSEGEPETSVSSAALIPEKSSGGTHTSTDEKPYARLYPDLYANSTSGGDYIGDNDYIYITFDDGPSINTPDILNYLDKWKVPATFFVVPYDSESSKNLLNRMLNAGHAIGIHSFSHDYNKIYESVESYLEDFKLAYDLVYKQTGYKPFLFRFPGGSRNNYNKNIYKDIIDEMTRRGFVYFDWNVDSEDALGADWTEMYFGVQKQVANNDTSIVLFHDGPSNKNTVNVMDDILKALVENEKRYTFSVINENTLPRHF
jgi:peptidoglycan/xylan/chitin deacetylase (PgdA/CDA1 family)